MQLNEVHKRWGASAAKWVWSTRPRYVFEADGAPRQDLMPVAEVGPEHYEDSQGWWTCHKDTRSGDLAVVYRNGGANDAGSLPPHGPKDLCQVVLATSAAFPLRDEPLAGEFSGHHGCLFVVVAEFKPAIGIAVLKGNPAIRDWGAMRAGFVQAAMPMPDTVWDALLQIDNSGTPSERPAGATVTPVPPEARRQVERDLESWLGANPGELGRLLGFPVEVVGRQRFCGDDHGGVMDLLLRRTDQKESFVVMELKADEVQREAVAQVLGYIGRLRSGKRSRQVTGVILGLEQQQQVPWVVSTVHDLVSVRHWDEVDLPDHLRAALVPLNS